MKWDQVSLGDLCEIKAGGTPSRKYRDYYQGNIPWVKISDLANARISSTDEQISEEGLNSCSAKLLPKGTILLSIFASIGKTSILEIEAATNQAIVGIIPKNAAVKVDFLRCFLKFASEGLISQGRGVAQMNINSSILKALEVPVPPPAEQKRIAAILDKADSIRRKRQQALQLTDDFLRSTFLKMFGDPVTNPMGWEAMTWGDLIKVKSGNGLIGKNMTESGIHPVYGGNGINGHHDSYMFDEPQIVIGRVGVYCGAVHLTRPQSWVTDNALYVAELKQPMDQTYLKYALTLADFNQYAGRAAQPLISGSRIYPVSALLPPLKKQREFSKLSKTLSSYETGLSSQAQSSDDLFKSLQQRAFSGQL